MGRLLAALALTCLIACESKVAPPAAPKEPVTNAQAKPAAAPAAPPLYDGAGNLLPSGEHVAWLELPRGLKVTPMALAEHHAFQARNVPADRILAFFGARLIANRVEKVSVAGQRLVACIPPSGSAPKQTTLDVSVIPGLAGTVTVYIDEHRYVAAAPFTSDDARSLLKEEQKRAE